ncbi:hypothetical protein L1987_14712 [Smallanthus sonchifolius]|uniref:Uncharacterized protein n=1 Tax=Smallanthus sonchifolius TaxID=185202 RepID=A0ACB9J5V2_9ASTR|nr:hypothetical protein L1987_14712 [Smallanthus sonchifolius]
MFAHHLFDLLSQRCCPLLCYILSILSDNGWNLSVTCTNKNLVPNTCASQSFYHFVECDRLCLKTAHLVSRVSPGLVFVRSFRGLQLRRAFHQDPHSEEASNFSELRDQLDSSYLEREPSDKETGLNNFVIEKRSDKDKKEIERRQKIGLANKGRVPWNKGKKHTPETRELISRRTKEALKDPKVRKKMSDCPRTLSEQTKAKIRITITQQWKERLKWKRSSERFISKWAESIAKAAKKGGHGQQELDWDSYDKTRSADMAKAKEMAQMRAERRAKAKAEKLKLTLKKRVAKVKGLAKKKSKEEKQELAAAEDLKLKERLTKIHRKKLINDQLSSRDQRAWERLDLDFWKRDARKEDISLADQIRDVKNKKAEMFIRRALITKLRNNPLSDTGGGPVVVRKGGKRNGKGKNVVGGQGFGGARTDQQSPGSAINATVKVVQIFSFSLRSLDASNTCSVLQTLASNLELELHSREGGIFMI